jgi:short-subunit dehydrogenase
MSGMQELTGRRALLTGASTGLGPIIARRLGRERVRLTLSARDESRLAALARELEDATVIVADLARPGEAERLAEAAGGVDLLISNAGVPANGRLADFTVENLDRALQVNLRSAMVLTRLLLPAMLARRSGHVVLMASMSGRVPAPGSSVYNATKFALRGFGYGLRAELRGTGVGVSLVSPTYVSGAGMWADTGLRARVRETTPEKVAEAVVRAIRQDRAEIAVAPVEQRLFSRLVLAFPDFTEPLMGRAAVPAEAVRRQESKR